MTSATALTRRLLDNFYHFFSHEDSRDSFAIPHDLRILSEVFGLEPGGYRRRSALWTAYAIDEMVGGDDVLRARQRRITARYAELSQAHQECKGANDIPLG